MLTRLSIKGRLFSAFAFLLTILLVVSASGLWAVREIRENLRVVYEERAVPTQLVAQVNYLSQRNRVLVMDMLVNPSDANSRKRLSEFDLNVRAIDEVLASYAAITRPPQQTALYEQFLKAWNTYMQDGLLKASQAMAKGDFDEAQFVYLNKISPLAPALQSSMEALMNSQLTLAGEGYESAKDMAQSASVSVASMLAVGVALGLLLAWAVARSITRPIELAGDMAQRVASGDLLPEPLAGGEDEMAHLIQKLDFMRGGLAEIVKEVREGSALIAASSGEISHGVSDLSQRTEAQASNLQEASASLDTLLRGTHEHATVSQQASSIAKAAYDSAAKGESSVEKLIVQIGTVSERSQRITEITSVIDSIAFQTNILALNAAVEAARAGEQGRGFAVVAQEVRVLAQRSAAAASEIKMLIVDAVNSVVQVTSMASSTGDSVRGFVAQVREVDVLIGQLSHASHEQARQLAQISEAIRHIDGMTQQNAALVEENAAAAMSLNHEASELDKLVASFKIQETGIVALSAA